MVYDAIVRGARGILYWGTAYIEKDSQLWQDLLRLARELTDRQPVLSAPDAASQPAIETAQTWGSLDHGVRVLAKTVDGKIWFLVVNESSEPLHYAITGLNSLEGAAYADPADEREAVVEQGALRLAIGGHGVQILEPQSAK